MSCEILKEKKYTIDRSNEFSNLYKAMIKTKEELTDSENHKR